MCVAGASRADVQWLFATSTANDNGTTPSATTLSFLDTTSTFSLTASGFAGVPVSTGTDPLFRKFTSGDPGETGLGLFNPASDHEIDANHFVQLDVSKFVSQNFSNLKLSIGSIQTGEGFILWGSNASGNAGTQLVAGTDYTTSSSGDITNVSVANSVLSTYSFFSVSATAPLPGGTSDVLIMNGLSVQSIPEPAFYQMSVLLGGGGLALLRARRRKRT
jgi:hypothetical protein